MLKLFLSNFQGYIIAIVVSAALSGYFCYDMTSNYYLGQIAKANDKAQKELNDTQKKGDELVAIYVKQIGELSARVTGLQKQVPMALGDSRCTISNGFVRLYNASASDQTSDPSDTDGTPSAVDLAAVLSTAIENNEKYNKLADQLLKIQEFSKSE